MTIGEITKIVTEQKQRDNLIREHAAKFAEEFENSSSTVNLKMALFDGFKFGAYWADEHPYSDIKRLLHVSQKTTESTKKEFINKACEWLENFLEKTIQKPSVNDGYTSDTIDLVELKRRRLIEEVLYDFKKAMEE